MDNRVELRRKIRELLWDLCVGGEYKGFCCCVSAVLRAVEQEGDLTGVFEFAASETGIKKANAVRNIATLSEQIFNRNAKRLREIAHDELMEQRPSAKRLVSILSTHVMRGGPPAPHKG